MTTNLFLERTFDDPLTAEDVLNAAREAKMCFDLYRVRWHSSFLSHDGHAMVCWFSSADMESARQALRDPDIDLSRFWSGKVHRSPNALVPNVAVERSFASPVTFDDIEAIGRAKSWCFETHRVRHVQSYHSLDGKRMLCFYAAPDAEAVRTAQREAGMPVEAIWAGAPIVPSRG